MFSLTELAKFLSVYLNSEVGAALCNFREVHTNRGLWHISHWKKASCRRIVWVLCCSVKKFSIHKMVTQILTITPPPPQKKKHKTKPCILPRCSHRFLTNFVLIYSACWEMDNPCTPLLFAMTWNENLTKIE